ncbi:hypothetical protein G9A89_020998 [Geosiphon pyriformis]|nr:hypothetical protein G9A89_020998 [Geosiphon pyriformis]
MKKTPVEEIDDFLFTIDEITIPVKVLVMDAPQYQALVRNNWLLKTNTNLNWETQELKILYQGQYTIVPAICDTFNKQLKKAPVFEFEEEKEMPFTETYMAFGLPSNWAEETEQEIFEESREWKKHAIENDLDPQREVKNGTKLLALLVEKGYQKNAIGLIRETLFDAAYNSALNKFYYYPHDAEMIFDLTMALINGATQEDVHQMKEVEYIEYTIELAEFDYEDECLECYALSILLPDENDENEIEFGISELVEKLPTTSIYLLKKQSPLQLKYFNNHGQKIRPEKAHEIDVEYDLRYPGKNTLVLQPKSLTKINLKIALKIPPGAMVQIASRLSLASKEINIRGRVIDAEYTGNITIMLQNETDKPFKIEHAKKIAQANYLPLINISGLQSVNNREQLGKSERKMQEIGIIYSNIFQDENPQIVSNFIEIVKHTLLSNPNIIRTTENYHFLEKKLFQINMGLLEPQQQRQLKQLIAEFADIFAKDNNDLGKTDIVQHQIHTGDALPKHQ